MSHNSGLLQVILIQLYAGQSWSGSLTQMNLWDFSIEKWDIENIAECRSDVFGNVVKVKKTKFIFDGFQKRCSS